MNRKVYTCIAFLFVVYTTIQAQAGEHFRFALLTDIHVTNKGTAFEDLQNSINQVNKTQGIDFVLVTGDITEEGDRASMKKVKTAAALLCSACLVLSGTAVPTMADSVKVVTLGADLTQDQKNTMMKYFNVDSNQVQILTITNQDERDHLSAYVPLEQIGTRTVSCAYVKPTQSGGIKVRTR